MKNKHWLMLGLVIIGLVSCIVYQEMQIQSMEKAYFNKLKTDTNEIFYQGYEKGAWDTFSYYHSTKNVLGIGHFPAFGWRYAYFNEDMQSDKDFIDSIQEYYGCSIQELYNG